MSIKTFIKSMAILSVFSAVVISVGYAYHKYDPFSEYKAFIKKPLHIKPKQLKHYAEEEQLIRAKLKLQLSERERSILAGIHWIISLADDDKNFDNFFSDFMLLLNNLSRSEDRIHQGEVVSLVAKHSLARAEKKLSELFKKDEESRWHFIGILQSLNHHPEFKENYLKFYKKNFGPILEATYKDDDEEYLKAIKDSLYQDIFDFLVQGSFLHYYLSKAEDSDLEFPPNKFQKYLKEFENFNYNTEHPVGEEFRSLGYLVTHVVLALTNYGEFPIDDGVNRKKAQAYIESSFEKTKNQLGDFDLFAEYILCLKIFNPGQDPRVKELEKFLFSLQRPNGSWGSERDFKTTSYTAIHPSGAALMALNQSNLVLPKP